MDLCALITSLSATLYFLILFSKINILLVKKETKLSKTQILQAIFLTPYFTFILCQAL
jgi:hypothetical protein